MAVGTNCSDFGAQEHKICHVSIVSPSICHEVMGPDDMILFWMFSGGSYSKESVCNVEDTHLIPGSGRSPGEGSGNPLQYSCLENSMDRETWWAKTMESQRVGHNWATNVWLLLSSFTFIKRLFSSSSLSAIIVVTSAHLRLLIVLLAILIPACSDSMIYKINKAWHL